MFQGRQDSKARLWFSGTAAYALAVTVFAISRPQAGPVSWIVIFAFSILSPLLMIESLRREIEPKTSVWPSYWIPLAVGILVTPMALIVFSDEYLARGLYLTCLCIIYSWLILLALRIKRQWQSRALDVVIFVFILFTLINVARILEFLSSGHALPLLSFTSLTNMVVMVNFLNSVFCSFGYWGFTLEKSQRLVEETSRRALEAATREQNANYREVLALEREALLTRMVELGRLAQAGALSASIAHEINQPLATIRLNLDSALADLENSPKTERLTYLLKSASEENLRAAQIIRRIRDLFYTRAVPIELRSVDNIIGRVLNLLRQNKKVEGVTINTSLHAPKPIPIAEGELEHVVINLMNNALDSVNASPSILKSIEIATEQDQSSTRIRITDNGSGVTTEHRGKLFDLAISSKPEGMGLGLWLARHIVERHHGRIYLDEQSDVGASFVVELSMSNHATLAIG